LINISQTKLKKKKEKEILIFLKGLAHYL